MAVTWVSGAGNFGVTPISLTLPAFQAGDLAVLIAGYDGADPTYTTSSGWTFAGKTAATNMFSYIWYRVLQAGDTSVTVASTPTGAGVVAAVGIWRNAAWVGLGTFGIRSGTLFTVVAPAFASASGLRLHLFGARETAATAGEADRLHTLTYGTARYFYAGDTTIGAATKIAAAYFSDSMTGSGDNTATLADSSTNAWGVQVAISDTTSVSTGAQVNAIAATISSTAIAPDSYFESKLIGAPAVVTAKANSPVVSVTIVPPVGVVATPARVNTAAVAPDIISETVLTGSAATVTVRAIAPSIPGILKLVIPIARVTTTAVPPDIASKIILTGSPATVTMAGKIPRVTGQWVIVGGGPAPISVRAYAPTIATTSVSASGRAKVNVAGTWTKKPAKYHNGTAWVEKPLKKHNGTTWVPLT